MPLRLSTGLRNRIMSSLVETFNGGVIKIYTGRQPSSPDLAPSGTLLCTMQGLTLPSFETLSGTAVATGEAGWFRLTSHSDDDSDSSTYDRLDGSVGSQLVINTPSTVAGIEIYLHSFSISMPSE
jgi:hypothetical protein